MHCFHLSLRVLIAWSVRVHSWRHGPNPIPFPSLPRDTVIHSTLPHPTSGYALLTGDTSAHRMSTFRGIVAEFPRIRIDYFRQQPDHSPPLACFLSHVHSDHLTGLESLRAPFVYCSAATREVSTGGGPYPIPCAEKR